MTDKERVEFYEIWRKIKPQVPMLHTGDCAAADQAAWLMFKAMKEHEARLTILPAEVRSRKFEDIVSASQAAAKGAGK